MNKPRIVISSQAKLIIEFDREALVPWTIVSAPTYSDLERRSFRSLEAAMAVIANYLLETEF